MSSPERWIGRLDFTPEIAQQLGIHLAQMTAFEMMLNKFFGILSHMQSQKASEATFFRIINISTRLDIIEALAALPENLHWQPKLGELVKEAKRINSRRNEYIHGTYRVTPSTGEVELLTWVTSESRKSARYVLTPKSIAEDTFKISAFLGEAMTLFHPHLKLEDAEPVSSPYKPPKAQ